jgi:DNA processing protein
MALAVVYPPENSPLADRIARQGVLVSEFEMGTQPEPSNFPRRNRVVRGMSLGTDVVETAPTGGGMITAAMALEQHREVFAVHSPIGGARPSGTNRLIREGKALLVESADDILAELGPRLIDIKDGPPRPPWPEPGRRSSSGGCSISWVMPRSTST